MAEVASVLGSLVGYGVTIGLFALVPFAVSLIFINMYNDKFTEKGSKQRAYKVAYVLCFIGVAAFVISGTAKTY